MTQRRLTATNQLSTVIDVLQMGKKTGLLTVERGEGSNREEGTMTLVHGQIVQAAIGSYAGRDAATKLFSWQACLFSFVPMLPEQINKTALPMPLAKTEAQALSENMQDPYYGSQPTSIAAQGDLNRRPLVTVYYKETMDETLRTLDRRGFSRIHRRLFLLIDGRRSVRELASLIGRPPNEITALLADLEQGGLIQF